MFGGYPYEPVTVVQDDFYCVVCLNLMKDAMQLDNCDHGMCNSCLQSLPRASQKKKSNPSCPTCRKRININKVYPAKMVNKYIKSLKVKCLHVAAGCEWQGDVLDAQPHLESKCLYEEILCSYSGSGCDIKIPRHTLEAHLQQCEFRQAVCDYCGESFFHSYLPVHFQECENFPVLCSHGCNMMVVRKSTDDHLQTCPELSVECPFKDAGCLQKMLRKDVHDHEVSTVTSHLLSTKRKLESELQTTKDELKASNERFAVAEERHIQTEKELQETKEKLSHVERKLCCFEESQMKLDQVQEKLIHSEKELRRTVIKLDAACESLNELSLKSQADVGFEVMIWENFKAIISSYKEKFLRKLSDNLADIVSKLLKSSEPVNDAFADLVVKTLQDFSEQFITTLPSVEEYTKQIESLFSPDFQKMWVLRLKQHFVNKATLEFSFFKSALFQDCEKYRGNRANTILTICLKNGVGTTYLGKYQCIKLDGNIGEPRLIDSKITFIKPRSEQYCSLTLMSLTDDLQTFARCMTYESMVDQVYQGYNQHSQAYQSGFGMQCNQAYQGCRDYQHCHWIDVVTYNYLPSSTPTLVKQLFCTYFGIASFNQQEFDHKYLIMYMPDVTNFTKNGYALIRIN